MLGKITPGLQQNLFKTRLTDLINLEHPLVKLADEVSWDKMELKFQNLYSEQGRPSIPIRKIARLLLLKEMFKERVMNRLLSVGLKMPIGNIGQLSWIFQGFWIFDCSKDHCLSF